jgi:archaellin
MPYCYKCGAELRQADLYCWKCGTKNPNYQPYYRHHRHWEQDIDERHYSPFAVAGIAVAVVVVVLVLVGALVFSSFIPALNSGNLQTRDMKQTNFTGLFVGNGFQVSVVQGANYSITVTADSNAFNYIEVTKNAGAVTIDLKPLTLGISTPLKAQVTMPSLQSIDLSGGSNLNAQGFNMTNNLKVNLSDGSTLIMNGQAGDLNVVCSGGSTLELAGMQVNNAMVNFSDGSHGTINLDGTLTANLSGGSNLQYLGNPTLGSINTLDGSNISGP